VTAPGVFADLAAQRACWHPVAFSSDLAGQPVHADLLGEPLQREGDRVVLTVPGLDIRVLILTR